MDRRHFRAGLIVLFAASLAAAVQAQTTGATLQGTVSDEQGAVLPGSTVTVINVETGWSRETPPRIRAAGTARRHSHQVDTRFGCRSPAL